MRMIVNGVEMMGCTLTSGMVTGGGGGSKQGELLRDRGIDQVLAAEKSEWRANALRWLRLYAMSGEPFTADDFKAQWLETGFDLPHSPNVWGGIFLTAARDGWLKNTGTYVKAKIPAARARRLPLWVRV